MRIAYCTNVRLPSERAHGHQVAQVCDALARLGHRVTIFAPFRRNVVESDFWTYYGASREIELRHLGTFDPIASQLFPGVTGLFLLNAMLRRSLRKTLHQDHFDLVYTRSPALLSVLLATGLPVVLELHQLPRRGKATFVRHCNRCRLVSCLTSPMRDVLESWGVVPDRLMVAGDAVDLSRFENVPTRSQARERWKIQTERLVVGYVGRLKTLGMEKGVRYLLESLKDLREQRTFFGFVVGGPEQEKNEYATMAAELGLDESDVLFTGEIPSSDIPSSLAACDVFVMPFPDLPHYRLHMSPLKMFEYMAAGRIIITSDLPTVRDVLSHDTAVVCKPGDVQSLVAALRWVADHPEEAAARAERARELVKSHTWEERMKQILEKAFPLPGGRGVEKCYHPSMKKILSVAAARPNFVKLAAVHHALAAHPDEFEHIIVHTGQHYDPLLSDVFFEQLKIPQPAFNLGVHGGTREEVIEMTKKELLKKLPLIKPDVILVYGDVNGALGAAEAAEEAGITLAHVEAGLRSMDLTMPEEHNRIGIDRIADILLCSEESGVENLKKEGVKGAIHLVGNTMIDTLIAATPIIADIEPLLNNKLAALSTQKFAIVTIHRPSNVDDPKVLAEAISFLQEISTSCPVILPAHPRLKNALGAMLPALIVEPMPYLEFLIWMKHAAFILTDSGGIQEEAVLLGKRCFTLRPNTERPSTVESGSNVLITDINDAAQRQKVLDFAKHPTDPTITIPQFWDGHAGERIVQILRP